MSAPNMKRAARLAPEAARGTAQNTSNGTLHSANAQASDVQALLPNNGGVPSRAETQVAIVAPAINTPSTVFPNALVETGETGETDLVGNGEFLQLVFGHDLASSCPMVVSFEGNPTTALSKVWFGSPWRGADVATSLPANANNYFSLATFRPDDAGRYRRKGASFHALNAIMLDDIGSKVPKERLTLAPSWLLETSGGNHQAGYLLEEPLTDGLTADRLMKAIITAGLCDPGADGPRTRLARLPVAMNGKRTPPFQCRLTHWAPLMRYSVAEIVSGLQLDVVQPQAIVRPTAGGAQGHTADGDPVLIPAPEENAVLAAMRRLDLYKAPLGEGKHEITCPWVNEHTGEVDGGTAYFEPDDHWPIGGFKCFHGHCADKRIGDLLRHLHVERSAARMKPTICVTPGEIHRIVDAAERELAKSRRHYQRGGLIVTVTTDPGTRETRLQEISLPALVRALAGVANWWRFSERAHDWVRVDPPARHAGVLFDSTSYMHLPVLHGLARQPYLRPDGSVMTAPAYDPATRMFGVFDAREFSVPDNPSRVDAEAALAVLADLLKEFSFAGTTDLAAALAAMITAAIRPSLSHAPMFHARAPMVGSGKSCLCELVTAFATPQRGSPTTFPGDDEECRKLLLAELLRGPAVIEFDNLTSDLLAHKSLCTALTSEYLSGRILGVSKTAIVSTRALFLSSGNNVGPIQDMTRRCITINLSPECEVPATRSFQRPDLVRDVLRERGRYVSAVLTIVRAWISAGRPHSACKSLAGYGDWSDLCRQPLLWLGCSDPTESVFVAMADDPDRETLGRVLTAWQSAFGETPTMIRDAVKRTGEHLELREVLHDIADERGQLNHRKLGWWIKRHAGRIVDGRRFVRGSGNRSAGVWQVESVSPVSPVSIAPSVNTSRRPISLDVLESVAGRDVDPWQNRAPLVDSADLPTHPAGDKGSPGDGRSQVGRGA